MRKEYVIDSKIKARKISDVIDDPIIIRVNKFTEESLEKFDKDVELACSINQPVVPIVIDSYGGEAYAIKGFISTIETIKVPVATIVNSKAMSCGSILAAFGTEGYRFMNPNATLMIHDVAGITFGKIEEIKTDAEQLQKINKEIYERMSLHIGKDKDYIFNLIREKHHADWYLSAKEAKKHNIINHIRTPILQVGISTTIEII